jgi:hypothetical protein
MTQTLGTQTVEEPDRQGPPATTERSWAQRNAGHLRVAIGWAVYLTILGVYVAFAGVPLLTDNFLLWITGAIFVSCLGDLGRFRRGFVRDWLPLYLVLLLYSLLRGFADNALFPPHIAPQLRFDEWVGGGTAPTVTLQRWMFDPNHIRIWDVLTWICYLSHFVTSFVLAAYLWFRDHRAFRRFMTLYVSLMLAGFVTYVLYPAMPPWMASEMHLMPASVRTVPIVFNALGIHSASAVFAHGSRFANDVAAMPSLHAACPMLICLFFWGRVRKPWAKALLALYVPAMAFTLVYTGEHYVIDIFVGWIYAIVIYVVGTKIMDRREARKAAEAKAASDSEPAIDLTDGASVPAS